MLVPIAFLFCPATSHMTIKLLAVGVQLTIRAQSQSASRDCSRSGTSRAKGITTKALRSGIRTIFAATMPRFVLMLMCDQEGPFESVAPSSIKLIGTAAPPMRSMPEKSQPRGAECRGTSRALIGGERPTRMPRVDAITAGLKIWRIRCLSLRQHFLSRPGLKCEWVEARRRRRARGCSSAGRMPCCPPRCAPVRDGPPPHCPHFVAPSAAVPGAWAKGPCVAPPSVSRSKSSSYSSSN
mmetsp:Transcript_30694/g.71535  ORF Transcript_30694/g.71535 Transcript_30694/m.71535 type:complete len:239 (+) Transcript_30694:157-873(+)